MVGDEGFRNIVGDYGRHLNKVQKIIKDFDDKSNGKSEIKLNKNKTDVKKKLQLKDIVSRSR
jgi:hypothetical protein